MSRDKRKAVSRAQEQKAVSSKSEVSAFLQQVSRLPAVNAERGRLLFALDATASRESAWDSAMGLQADMFVAAHSAGSLEIQLAYFRGFAEFYISNWCRSSDAMLKLMTGIQCRAGTTQIERVLRHTLEEHRKKSLHCLVYIGDAVEENQPVLRQLAGQCGLLNIPIFLFQDGHDPDAKQLYQSLAKLSKGAYFQFDSASAKHLRELLQAVAVYATGGWPALESYADNGGGAAVLKLTQQMKGKSS
ncbi:MAG: VWA domain-containing protein [Pseudohongiellaceae bacterium]|nr:VWA domain-containing protein [Pseudohongiellaceae bacterium]